MTSPYAKRAAQLILEDRLPSDQILDAATICQLFSINENRLEDLTAVLVLMKQKWINNGI